jgi:hypothetical protein
MQGMLVLEDFSHLLTMPTLQYVKIIRSFHTVQAVDRRTEDTTNVMPSKTQPEEGS